MNKLKEVPAIKLIPTWAFKDVIGDEMERTRNLEYINTIKERLKKFGLEFALFHEVPLTSIAISSDSDCIQTFSPTTGEEDLSLIATFTGKRIIFSNPYYFNGNSIVFKEDELKEEGCMSYASNPNIPLGFFMNEEKIVEIAKKLNGLVVVDSTYDFLFDNDLNQIIINEKLARLLDQFREAEVLVIKKLHKIFGLYENPLILLYTNSHRVFETLSLITNNEERLCIDCLSLYGRILSDNELLNRINIIKEKLEEKKKELINVIRSNGGIVFESLAPYFVASSLNEKVLKELSKKAELEKAGEYLFLGEKYYVIFPKL
ncbi:aminotransferase class I/II-fold pyridoxal phosphate-dependent enzyme [Fervidicoccus fontis]|uniref:Aminotransferase class I/II-fold pyridoxal phosphate-dependent enzyme n=1 Tax=Fervidicoccus fontis TaxID=683846 RepID=A0A7C2VHI7_9CREN|nr:aminotransferase class I/II-fold pyridoxal phosphate-dependent enzyme [Fervidicoccus fontis]HEW63685.1 aminotransferase class I/II-fold pyridoxal phosphate-dependent enzyme [Fervidicoccus fontis]